jgi:hypothetical protein
MRVPAPLPVGLALAALVAGCGGGDESTPVVCTESAKPYMKALDDAPGEVRLEGDVAISDCLVENQDGGELASVGEAMVVAATQLNMEAREDPGGEANVAVGYLVGAAQRGAEDNEGIDAELIRRLAAAASYSPDNRPPPAEFESAYREGFDAGHEGG